MPSINLGRVKGDKGDPFRYSDFTKEQLDLLKGDTPIIQAGTATSLPPDALPTVSAEQSVDGITTTFNFGIPKGDTSDIKTPTFDDDTETYTTLSDANTAAETTSNEIKSNVSLFTTLSNIKKSFSAIIQGLKILGNNVGMIQGITSDLNSESDTIAASSKAVATLNSNLINAIGNSIKLADKIMIQYGTATTSLAGSIYPVAKIVFPIPFKDNPYIIATPVMASSDQKNTIQTGIITNAGFSAWVFTNNNTTSAADKSLQWIAIGKC